MDVTRTIILNRGDVSQKRREIQDYFHATFDIDEKLMKHLADDNTFYLRADPLRHPLIFYFGHTAVFYINKLILAESLKERIHPEYESMFAVGVDEMSWDDLNESHYDWPSVREVQDYRNQVRQVVDTLIQTMNLEMPINWSNPWWIIMMGIEHARIHLETSSVLIRQLPLERVRPVAGWQICEKGGPSPQNNLLEVEAGQATLGKNREHRLYGWDNEFGTHVAEVSRFLASKYLVSNQEYLEFVEDGGYKTERWWTEEGWNWRLYKQPEYPLFWRNYGNQWHLRTVASEIAMPWNWPVEVNYLEAKAFCNWKSEKDGLPIRLPTEDEWYRLRDLHVLNDQPDWLQAPGNINLEHYCSSCPIDQFAFGEFYDIIGNVWQWTETPIYPLDGFKTHPVYDDFSTPTFDNKHNLIKGGSWISTGNEATRDSRYAFRRHFYQHAGLRYIQSDKSVEMMHVPYECEPEVCQACELHYGNEILGVSNFPAAIAQTCVELMNGRPKRRALDLGCSAGRATWELAKSFEQVTGIDLTARIMRVGDDMKRDGRIRYRMAEEGELESYHERTLEELGYEDLIDKVEFWQNDPCNLKQKALFNDYDLVLVQDLLIRLYDPERFLREIHFQMTERALLVIVTSNQWATESVPKNKWLGGYRKDGDPYRTHEGLKDILSDRFELIDGPREYPRVIRINSQRFTYERLELTAWEKLY